MTTTEPVSFLSPEDGWTVAGYFEDVSGTRTEGWALYRDRQLVAIFHRDEQAVAERCAVALNEDRADMSPAFAALIEEGARARRG